MQKTPDNLAMLALIRSNAATSAGYCIADAKGLAGHQYSVRCTSQMIKHGELVRVKVPGHFLRFVATQAQADILRAALLAGKPKRTRDSDRAKSAVPIDSRGPLRRLVASESQSLGGTTRADCAHAESHDGAFARVVQRLIEAGKLHRCKVKGHAFRYFADLDNGTAWQAATPPYSPPVKPRQRRPKPQATPKVTKVVISKAVKPATPRPVRAIGQHQKIVIRREYSPPAPRVDAVIVWPARMPECRMMPDRYAVSVPMQRIGTASWVTL